jgi:hypothetical protein
MDIDSIKSSVAEISTNLDDLITIDLVERALEDLDNLTIALEDLVDACFTVDHDDVIEEISELKEHLNETLDELHAAEEPIEDDDDGYDSDDNTDY